jgi:hypothetical protein
MNSGSKSVIKGLKVRELCLVLYGKYDSILSLFKKDLMHGTSLGRQVKIGFFPANFQLNFAKNVMDGS